MITCATDLLPRNLHIAHSPLLEVKAITVTTAAGTQMCASLPSTEDHSFHCLHSRHT